MKSALSWANLDISAGVVRNVWCWLWCCPLSSIVWANFLDSGWFVQLAHSCYLSKSCYFFSYLPTVSFFPATLFILLPKWTVTFFPTCPLLLSFLLLFFLLAHCYFFSCYFFSCYFFSYPKLLLSFLLPFFLLLSFRALASPGFNKLKNVLHWYIHCIHILK